MDQHKRSRKDSHLADARMPSLERDRAFRQARIFMKTGQHGRAQALIAPFRGIRRGTMVQIQDEWENT
jgi:hypothetical protein